MSIFNFFKNQFIEVIEWTDDSSNTLVYRFPVANNEIKMGAKLIVRESQVAIFVNEGEVTDVFGPGHHELVTRNMPVMTKLKSWPTGFNSPFKAEVYFVNTKQFINQKWGTSNPIMMRDPEFGVIRLRGYGIYSYRVSEPKVFLQQLFGTNGVYTTEAIEGHLKKMIISGLSDLFAESGIPALDLAMHYDELSEAGREKMRPRFEAFGFDITSLYIENLSLPKEVEQTMDERTSMGVLGDMNQYQQFQAAKAIREAAQNEGGAAGLGAGFGAGQAMGHMLNQAQTQQPSTPNVPNMKPCPHCQEAIPHDAKFCSHCGKSTAPDTVPCVSCGAAMQKGAKFCPECGAKQQADCPKCGHVNAPGTKFCSECGENLQQ